jgi:hypothetical protein
MAYSEDQQPQIREYFFLEQRSYPLEGYDPERVKMLTAACGGGQESGEEMSNGQTRYKRMSSGKMNNGQTTSR